jgi:peptidoglycan/LPS O-acetylase OafA/YrhL
VDVAVRASPRRVRPAWPITGVPNAPGLDGVRGVAVLAVLAYHMDLAWTGGGFLGVEVFFALSGFLITQLLVDELSRTGRVDAWAFTKARARRLLPALVACVVGTVALFGWVAPTAGLRADGLASLLYVQNWHLVVAGLPYSEAFARPSPLLHLWSLSVEGQLYLVWPLLLVGVLATARRSTALLVTILLAFASALLMALRYDPDGGSLAYYATDARASGFLVGAALAWVWRPTAWSAPLPRVARWGIDAAGIAALVTLVVGFVAVSEFDAGLYQQGGFLRVGLIAAALIVAATRGGGVVAALLSRPPVVAVGRRSYGLYLYHWPIFVLGRELPLAPWKINLLGLLLTVAVAEASYRWIETPVRRGGLGALMRKLPRPAAVLAAGAATSAVLATVVTLTAPVAVPDPAAVGADASLAQPADAAGAPACAGAGGAAAGGAAAGGGAAGPAAAGGAAGGADPTCGGPAVVAAPPAAPAPVPPAAAVGGAGPALVVGDSIALGSAESLRRALGAGTVVDAKVGRQFSAAPAIVGAWAGPGPVVVDLGANGTVQAADIDAVVAAAGDRRVVLVGVHVPRRWQDGNNDVLRAAATAHPTVEFVDWSTFVGSTRKTSASPPPSWWKAPSRASNCHCPSHFSRHAAASLPSCASSVTRTAGPSTTTSRPPCHPLAPVVSRTFGFAARLCAFCSVTPVQK